MGISTNFTVQFQKCIDECNKCTQACYECFKACLYEPDVQARRNCIDLLIECAQMCQMSSAVMSMNGQFMKEHCKLCVDVCNKCAAECDKFKDDHCRKCATQCYACVDECNKMSNM